MELPKFSIITLSFNSERTLERAMDSLLAQGYPNIEYIVMDGGSKDASVAIIRAHEKHISFWRSHPDKGPGHALNEGLEQATGDIVGILNSDDWYEPGILKAVAEAFVKHPEVSVVTTQARLVEERPEGLKIMREFRGKDLALDGSGSLIINARFFRRSVFERHGLFMVDDEAGRRVFAASDLDFLLRIFLAGEKQEVVSQLGYTYTAHPASLTFSGSQTMSEKLHRERGIVAARFLARADLPWHIRRKLKRWNTLGTTRDFLWALREKDWEKARAAARQGFRIQPVYWPMYLVKISFYKLVGIPK